MSPTQGIFPTGAWGRGLTRPCLRRARFSGTKVSITESKTCSGLSQKFCELHYKIVLPVFPISQANRQVKFESEVLWRITVMFRIEKYKAITNSLGSTNVKTIQKRHHSWCKAGGDYLKAPLPCYNQQQ